MNFWGRLAFAFIPFLGMIYIRFVALTSRIIEYRREIADTLIREGNNVIFAFWHNRQFMLGYIRRNDRIKVLVSESRDGECIARIIAYFGIETVRGSTSRGAVRAMRDLLRFMEKGYLVGITPDGPRGPSQKVQKGLLMLASRSGSPIIPLSYGAKRKKILRSWDKYIIPYPFNRIVATYGEPIYIGEDDDLEQRALFIEERLNANSKLSDKLASGWSRDGKDSKDSFEKKPVE